MSSPEWLSRSWASLLELAGGALVAPGTWLQIAAVATTLAAAALLARPLRARTERWLADPSRDRRAARAGHALLRSLLPATWLVLLWITTAAIESLGSAHELLRVTSSLLGAWVVIGLTSTLVGDPSLSRLIATVAWGVAALNILHLLAPTIALLDGVAITLGETRVSLYLLVKGLALTSVFLWCAVALGGLFQRRIERLPNLTPSVRVLAAQSVRFTLIIVAVAMAMTSIGVDLTAFAVFSGAVGVGVGFGLQKVVSNLVSGVILLLDRSIKPGDVIQVGDTYGWLNSLGARYASVLTRDGTEYLIPNEDLITQQVINWSYSDNLVRRRLPIGVSYKSDIELATKLILEAVAQTERCLAQPEPQCLLRGFGDSSVELEARFWIQDPQNGTANVADQVLRRVWHSFHANGIEIPFPQRDVHIKSAPPTPRPSGAAS
jgi:small-conductance mechanosensitive channel